MVSVVDGVGAGVIFVMGIVKERWSAGGHAKSPVDNRSGNVPSAI